MSLSCADGGPVLRYDRTFPEQFRGDAMSADQDSGFVVRDRRGGNRPEDAAPAQQAVPPQPETRAAEQPTAAEPSSHEGHSHMPLTFSSFVFSLSTSAMMLMGEQLDPRQSPVPVNLAQAKEIIDILSLLETKTKGNLTGEEQSVLTEMLYALRMKFVELSSGKTAASSR